MVSLLHQIEELPRRELLGFAVGRRDVHARRAKLLGTIELRVRFDIHLVPVEASVVVLCVGGSGAGWLRLGPLCELEAILRLGCRELTATEISIFG